MKTLILLLFIIIPTFVFSQSTYQQWEWAKSFGGTGNDSSVDIKIKNGYLYVTGTFNSPVIKWDNTILTNAGGTDIFMAKMDTNGNTIWVKSFGGSGDDRVLQLEVNNNGEEAIWCTSSGNNIVVGNNTITNPENFYIKLDDNGNVLNSNKQPASCVYQDFDIGDDGAVYFSGQYVNAFTFASQFSDTTNSKTGGVIFKYNSDGSEAWAKYIALYNDPSIPNPYPLPPITAFMRIEYSNIDATLAFVFEFYNARSVDLTHIGFTGSYSQTGGPKDILSGKLSDTSLKYLLHSYPIGGSLNGGVYDFEIGNTTGLSFSFYKESLLSGTSYYLRKDYDLDRQIIRSWFYDQNVIITGDYIGTDKGTLRTNDAGTYIVFNIQDTANRLEILDTNLINKKLIIIPAFGSQNWKRKCFANTDALYFSDTYSNSSLQLNRDIQGGTIISLQNNGLANIFIGKYKIQGNQPLSLAASPDRYRVCSDSVSTALAITNTNTGPLTYNWQPSSIVSDTSVLNPKFFITAGSVVATLTVSDTAGRRLTQDFTFFKGTLIDLRLVPSDTIVCRGDTITLSLAGTQFTPAYCIAQPYQPGIYGVIFNTPNDIYKYKMASDHTLLFSTYNVPLSPPSKYCVASDSIHISTSKSYATQYVTICQGGSYFFPDGHQAVYVRSPLTYTSTINSLVVCDSIITTYLSPDTLPAVDQIKKVCRGASFTFPDGFTIGSVQSDMTYVSYLHSSSGCDTMTIRTNLQVGEILNTIIDTVICNGSSYTFPDDTTFTNIQSAISHTSYFKNIYGCDSIVATNVTLYPLYQATKNVSVCAGASYTFPNDTTIYNIVSPFTHTSILTSINGCDSIINYTISVISIDTSVLKNGKTLTANFANANYQWLNCTNTFSEISDSINQSFTASLVGEFAVEITNQGCVDTSTCYAISLADFNLGGRMQANVYPVPSKNTYTIKINVPSLANIDIVLIDFFGKKINSMRLYLQPGENIIYQNISTLSSGTYTLKLVNSQTGETITKKIIKI